MRENQANNESKLRRAKKTVAKLAEYDSIEKHGMTKVEHSYPTAKKADSKARVLEAFRRRHGDERHIYLVQISREGKTVRMWRDC